MNQKIENSFRDIFENTPENASAPITHSSFKKSFIAGAIITAILGTFAHFAYDWSGNLRLVGLITAVNESTWEHMKLLFFPMLLVSIFLVWRHAKKSGSGPLHSRMLFALLTGNLIGTFLIPILFYTYSGILGQTIDAVNIAIYYICVIVAFYNAYKLTQKECPAEHTNLLLLITFVMILLFFIFSYYPPELGIFADPEMKLRAGQSHQYFLFLPQE